MLGDLSAMKEHLKTPVCCLVRREGGNGTFQVIGVPDWISAQSAVAADDGHARACP